MPAFEYIPLMFDSQVSRCKYFWCYFKPFIKSRYEVGHDTQQIRDLTCSVLFKKLQYIWD